MAKRLRHPYPEIYCDLNARMTERGYLLSTGSVEELTKLGLTLESAMGKRFTFVQDDTDKNGESDGIMFNGVVIRDEKFGYLAFADEDGIYWRSEIVDE